MQVNVLDIKTRQPVKTVDISDDVFDVPYNEALIHQVVCAYQAGARAGTKAQKSRNEVSGGGIKPWRQKGTGRARAGSSRSPIWRKGGVTFAAKPRDYSQKVNKKMYRGCMRSILSQLIRDERLFLVDSMEMQSHKTKEFLAVAKEWLDKKLLLVTDVDDVNLFLSTRNLKNIWLMTGTEVNPYGLLAADYIVLTEDALKQVEELIA